MSRPDRFDETCDLCDRVVREAPFYEGYTVGKTVYCDPCLKKHHPETYEKHRKHKSEERFREFK